MHPCFHVRPQNNTAAQQGGAFHVAGVLTSFTLADGSSVMHNKVRGLWDR